ncbi:MAG TPA: right-handed parallel beta-helix repeat-containing protein, partial [Roseiflexaceae bacterium]|nr:right-handed parallel beta-helix repeat-containing protein [Roseiflexaceae bacterium]
MALALATLPPAPARAADATVRNCTESGLREAIAATAGSGTVLFDCGGPATITLTAPIVVPTGTSLTIRGERLITISGGGAVRLFEVAAGAALTLDGLTLAGGAGGDGGAVLNLGDLTVIGAAFVDNRADFGGAIASRGTARVSDSVFSRNQARFDGGAIAVLGGAFALDDSRLEGNSAGGSGGGIFSAARLTVQRTRIQGNSASSGGGLHSVAGAATLSDSEVSANRATTDGGGARNEGDLALIGSTVAGNTTATGSAGGIDNTGTLTLTNSTVSGNQAAGNGGGIESYGTLRMTAATVAANGAGGTGGGVFNGPSATAVLTSTLLAGNSAAQGLDCTGALTSGGNNLLQRSAGCTFAPGVGDLLDMDPLLGPLADNGGPSRTHALLPGSPAVDVVSELDPFRCQIRDQRGVNRPIGLGCDIGAFELGFVVNSLADAPAHNPLVRVCATSPPASVCTLRAALQHANALSGMQAITFAVSGTITLSPAAVDPMRPEIEPDGIADLDITQDVIIIGRRQITLDGAGDPEIGGVLHVAAGVRATVVGLTIRDGAGLSGAGVRNEGNLTLIDSVVTGNSAAQSGGGISNEGVLSLVQVTVSDNSASSDGGGINNPAGSQLTIADSTISGNAATGLLADGGGISTAGKATLTNVTVSDNRAAQDGGGIAVLGGGTDALRLNNVTVAGNTADASHTDENHSGDGGGISIQNGSGDVTLMNSLLAGNEDLSSGIGVQVRPDCAGSFISLGYNLVGVAGTGGADRCIPAAGPGDQLGSAAHPLLAGLGPLQDRGGPTKTRPLLTGSPALEAGSPAP